MSISAGLDIAAEALLAQQPGVDTVGAKMRRIELTDERLLDEETMVRGLISQVEDADLVEGIVQLRQRETAYQTALGAAGRALNLSLMGFPR